MEWNKMYEQQQTMCMLSFDIWNIRYTDGSCSNVTEKH